MQVRQGDLMRTAADAFERSAEYFRLSAMQTGLSRDGLVAVACKLWETAIDLHAVECQYSISDRRRRLN